MRAKAQQKPHGKHKGKYHVDPKAAGDLVTGDHFVAKNELDRGFHGESCGLVLKDAFLDELYCRPCSDKSADEAYAHMNAYEGPYKTIKMFYSDNSGELIKAAKMLGWVHGKSTVGIPQTNGQAENAVKRVIHGTRCALAHAGFEERYWSFAAPCWCFNRTAVIVDGNSIFFNKYGVHIDQRKIYPFGCRVDFLPDPDWSKDNRREMSPVTVQGIFLGYVLPPGGQFDDRKGT